jgi:UDP-2,3-diacylglucosamine hydrolase
MASSDIMEIGAIPVRKNKLISGDEDVDFSYEDNEWLILYSKKENKPNTTITLFFGHRHLPSMKVPLAKMPNM